MNSLERISAAVTFQKTDRTPVIAQVFGHAAVLAGVPLEEYVRDGELLARCQLQALAHYGYDAVFSVMDAGVETEAVGSILRYHKNRYPVVEKHVLAGGETWPALPTPDPRQAGRMPEMLKALGLLRRELGQEVLIVGCVVGPFTLAAQLLGMEKTLFLAVDDPPLLAQLLDFATRVIIDFGRAQLEAGAHLPIVFDPAASCAVIPPRIFQELELPRLRQVFQSFTGAGAAANWLHIAGPSQRILSFFPEAGVQIANFDYYISPAEAQCALPDICLDGNLKPLLFVEGAAGDIEAEATKLLEAFGGRGGFILSSGCEIPPEARPENVAALVHAGRTVG